MHEPLANPNPLLPRRPAAPRRESVFVCCQRRCALSVAFDANGRDPATEDGRCPACGESRWFILLGHPSAAPEV